MQSSRSNLPHYNRTSLKICLFCISFHKKKKWIGHWLIGILLAIGPILSAEQSIHSVAQPQIKQSQGDFLVEDMVVKIGLNSSDISALFQDHQGFIWIGTKAGLSRFDGQQVEEFTFVKGKSVARIHDIVEDKQGVIWAGGINGLFRFDQGILSKVNAIEQSIMTLHMDDADNLLIGGLFFPPYALSTDQRKRLIQGLLLEKTELVSPLEWDAMVNDSRVWDITGNAADQIWVGLEHQLLMIKNQGMESIWEDFSRRRRIQDIVVVHSDSIYFGSETTGLYKITNGNLTSVTNDYTYISQVTDSALYVLTASNLLKLTHEIDTLFDFVNTPDFYFKEMLLDAEGNFWIGTEGNLFKLTPRIFYNYTVDNEPLLAANFSITELETGKVLIGSSKKNILQISAQGVALYDSIEAPSNSVTEAIIEDDEGNIWYGTSMGGIVMHGKNGHYHFSVQDGLFDTEILFFRILSDGSFWCGGYNGISRIEKTKKGFQFNSYSLSREQPEVPEFLDLILAPNRTLWAISNYGLYYLQQDTLLKYELPLDHDLPPISGVSGRYNQSFLISTEGNGIWQFEFDQNNLPKLVTTFGKQEGLLSDVALNVHLDQENRIWGFYQNGISMLDQHDSASAVKNYTYADGLAVKPSAKIKIMESSEDELWIVRKSSVSRINLYNTSKNWIPPQSYIRAITLAERKSPAQYTTTFRSDGLPDYFRLPHTENFIQFDFTCTSFTRSEKNTFQFYLSGLDDQWNDRSTNTSVQYRGLPPGSYQFYVRAFNNDGVPGPVAEPISFTILRPIYARWWAWMLYIVIAIFITYLIYRYYLEKKEQELEAKRLKELDAFKTTMYTNITHEFRTPLTVIQGMATELKRYMNTTTQKKLQLISKNSQKLLELVNQMLDFSKVQEGRLELNYRQDEVIQFLRYLVESFSSYAESKGIDMEYKSDIDTIIMDVDHQKLEHVMTNLISNAIKFTAEHGKIYVHVKQENERLIIDIKDSGIGIAEEELPNIFKRFHQVNSTQKNSGTGIGLALANELITLMEGQIEVQSNLNQGTTFSLTLPIRNRSSHIIESSAKSLPEDRTVDSSEPQNTPVDSDSPQLLIVEDNEDVAYYIKNCVEDFYQVKHTKDGQDGLQTALELIPDIVISDVMMPKMDGFELCRQLKLDERTNHVPVILLTAKATVEDRITGIQFGADAYLTKPFNKHELLARLKNLMDIRKTLHEKYQTIEHHDHEHQNKTLPPKDPFLMKVEKVIHDHIGDDQFSSKELAASLYLSSSQVYRKIKALTGLSTAIFIRMVRLEKSKEYLLTHTKSITEISYDVGFKSPVYFSQAFKDQFGISPSEYRTNMDYASNQ